MHLRTWTLVFLSALYANRRNKRSTRMRLVLFKQVPPSSLAPESRATANHYWAQLAHAGPAPTRHDASSSCPLASFYIHLRNVIFALPTHRLVMPTKSSTFQLLTASNPCTPSNPSVTGSYNTSTSKSFITPMTTPRLSIIPFTATRNMRFVVAA